VGNANQPDTPAIRAVSAGGNGPFGAHVQTFGDDSTEPVSQWWAVPCSGGVSFYNNSSGRLAILLLALENCLMVDRVGTLLGTW